MNNFDNKQIIQNTDILNASNGGLDIILSYYPQAEETLTGKAKSFKIRSNEKTPSASLKKMNDGNWIVTDFGGDQIPRNAIQVAMLEESLTYREAIVMLAGRYNVGGLNAEINKPDFEKRSAKPEEKEGEYFFKIKEEISKKELETLGNVTQEVCTKYNLYSLESFTHIKNREAYTTKSTDNYPIFLFDWGSFKKIYQPKNPDKSYRFRYTGEKDKDFIYGLDQVRKEYKKLQEEIEKNRTEDNETPSPEKLPELIIASGDRDALNVASFGYPVVWLNSETALLSDKQYKELEKYADTIYLLPDIDSTGKKAAIRQGLTHLDLHIIWLPESLRKFKDNRGNPRKDFTDYVDIYKSHEDFKKLIRVAMPLRFWDQNYGKHHLTGKIVLKYQINNEKTYQFLAANGFCRVENKNTKAGFVFVRINGNIITEVKVNEIKGFIIDFLKDRFFPIELRNMVHTTTRLTENSLEGLPMVDLDFTDFTHESQFLFFENKTWEVKANQIKEYKPDEINRYVWNDEVIKHKVKLKDSPFRITWDAENEIYKIEILNKDSLFLRFLINGSRIYWQKELETELEKLSNEEQEIYKSKHQFSIDGALLTDEEIEEQKQHLINKIFSLGYLLHRYKNPARPWAVYAMDAKISEGGESHGRSGKSIMLRSPRYMMKTVVLQGRKPELTENKHIYDRVTEHTDYVLVDDCNQYLNFNFFFSELSGEMGVNPKNNQSYEIPFEKSPKFGFTSNFALRNIDSSTEGRLLYTVFSDYYHIKGTGDEYRSDKSVESDFGKLLFNDYNEEEWNEDFNFFARCLEFYLSVGANVKINPPLENVKLRNLITEMGDSFKDWADTYFIDENLNNIINKAEAFDDFIKKTNIKRPSPQKFLKSLKAWCKFKGYILNPKALTNSENRIIRKLNGKAQEFYFIQSTNEIKPEFYGESIEHEPAAIDELPY